MGPGGTFAHRSQPVQVGGSRLSALPSPHEVGHRELGRASPGSDSLRGSLCPAPRQISLQSASARVRGRSAPPARPAGRARLSPRPTLGSARLSPAARLRARLRSAAAAAPGISPQLGSRPRPPGPRPCRPSSAWWSATGECAVRRSLGRARPAGLAQGILPGRARGSGARPGRRRRRAHGPGIPAGGPGAAARMRPDRPVGVRGPGRGWRTWWGGVPAIRRAQASSPGPPDAASCPRPRPASGWVGPGLSPGLNPQRVPPSRYLPGALRRLAAARTHHSVPKAHLSLVHCGSAGQAPLSPPWDRGRGAPLLSSGQRWTWEQRGLALSPQRRGEDLLADQLHNQRLPRRIHPHSVSRRGGSRGGEQRVWVPVREAPLGFEVGPTWP